MKLKITGNTPERFESNLKRFLNLSTLVCLKGYVPSQNEIEKPELGRWWILEEENKRYQLLPSANDYWLNIREKGTNYIILDFSYRYDSNFKMKNALCELTSTVFDFVEKIES